MKRSALNQFLQRVVPTLFLGASETLVQALRQGPELIEAEWRKFSSFRSRQPEKLVWVSQPIELGPRQGVVLVPPPPIEPGEVWFLALVPAHNAQPPLRVVLERGVQSHELNAQLKAARGRPLTVNISATVLRAAKGSAPLEDLDRTLVPALDIFVRRVHELATN